MKPTRRFPPTSVFVDGDERPGVIAYGIWPAGAGADLPSDVLLGGGVPRAFRLWGPGWVILGFDIAYPTPEDLREALPLIEECLELCLRRGAHVAWLGSEGLPFADPPHLFDPEWMEGGVLLAKTVHGATLEPGPGATALRSDQLLELHTIVTGMLRRPLVERPWVPLLRLDGDAWAGLANGALCVGTMDAAERPVDPNHPIGLLPCLERPRETVLTELRRREVELDVADGVLSPLVPLDGIPAEAVSTRLDQWVRPALEWLANMPPSRPRDGLLAQVEDAAWASQDTRQRARTLRRSLDDGSR